MQLIYWKSSCLLEMLNFAIDFLPYILKELIHDLGMFFSSTLIMQGPKIACVVLFSRTQGYSLLGQTKASLLNTSFTCFPLLLIGPVLSLRPHC